MGHLLGKNLNFKKVKKKGSHTVFDPQSVRECPKILKICQITNLDMGFLKIDIRSRSDPSG